MRILIVDDEEACLIALQYTLEKFGHEVELARDGCEALRVLRSGCCRLVISDWMMPRMDGTELCKAVRGEDFDRYIYFILLTTRAGTDSIVEGLSAGADDFLVKPFHPGELRVRIQAAERMVSLETRDVAIFAMAKLAESRDPETGAHLERVRSYSRLLARELGRKKRFKREIDAEFVRLIYLTSPLHDIGKVGIPDSVLLKPGRLSDREFEIMKTHTTIGAATLSAAMEQFPDMAFLRMGHDIALSHHERWDGSGYPSGLKGDDIPLGARIVALADVYDALGSKRVYKEAFAHEIARSMVLQEAGKHFDPAVVEVFDAHESEFRDIREIFAEAIAAA